MIFQNYSYLLHQEYRLYLFNTIIKLDSNNYSRFLAIHRQLSTSLCDLLRLKLATSSKIYDKATAPIYIIGNDFVDSRCCQTALPTDFSQSIFSGNFCLDRHLILCIHLFIFVHSKQSCPGGIPIPVGFTYPHVQSDFNIMSITNEDDLLLLKSSLVKNLGKTFRCSITPPETNRGLTSWLNQLFPIHGSHTLQNQLMRSLESNDSMFEHFCLRKLWLVTNKSSSLIWRDLAKDSYIEKSPLLYQRSLFKDEFFCRNR